MAYLYGTNTKISELAESVGVSSRSAHGWVYERNPGIRNRKKVSDIVGVPEEVLFFDHCGEEDIDIPFETSFKQRFQREKIRNVILAGLMVVHNINPPDLAEYLGLERSIFQTQIHEGAIPSRQIQDKVCKFFKLPPHIVYNRSLFFNISFSAKEFRPSFYKEPSEPKDWIYPRQRALRRWDVIHPNLLQAIDEKYAEESDPLTIFANDVDVSRRMVLRWIYEGSEPYPHRLNLIEQVLGESRHYLFLKTNKRKI